jgi:subtilisin-like proprotein convertase family protein
MRFRHLRAGATTLALALTLHAVPNLAPAGAAAPPAPPGCGADAFLNAANPAPRAVPDGGAVTSQLVVSGAGARLRDADLQTHLPHTRSGDLAVELRSPAGTVATITTGNGGDLDDVFAGTVWDDDAGDSNPPGAVTDATLANGQAASTLVPEEAMAAFIGENPNGTWELTVRDTAAGDTGELTSWSLLLTTCSDAEPALAVSEHQQGEAVPIPDQGTVVSALGVSGPSCPIADADVRTRISHPHSGDLEVRLESPAGTLVTLATDIEAGGFADVFSDTLWDDDAGEPVTDAGFTGPGARSPFVPEEAMGAFIGEDANGTWALRISDDDDPDTGALNGWSLRLGRVCAPAPAQPTPPAADSAAPRLGRVRVAPRSFRPAAGRRTRRSRAGARPAGAAGTRISYRVTEAGRTSFAVDRAFRGRRSGRRCERPTSRNRDGRRCVRWRRLRGGFSDVAQRGVNRLRWSGRLRSRPLRRGTYRLVARARDGAGNRSRHRRATFRITR